MVTAVRITVRMQRSEGQAHLLSSHNDDTCLLLGIKQWTLWHISWGADRQHSQLRLAGSSHEGFAYTVLMSTATLSPVTCLLSQDHLMLWCLFVLAGLPSGSQLIVSWMSGAKELSLDVLL